MNEFALLLGIITQNHIHRPLPQQTFLLVTAGKAQVELLTLTMNGSVPSCYYCSAVINEVICPTCV